MAKWRAGVHLEEFVGAMIYFLFLLPMLFVVYTWFFTGPLPHKHLARVLSVLEQGGVGPLLIATKDREDAPSAFAYRLTACDDIDDLVATAALCGRACRDMKAFNLNRAGLWILVLCAPLITIGSGAFVFGLIISAWGVWPEIRFRTFYQQLPLRMMPVFSACRDRLEEENVRRVDIALAKAQGRA